MDFGVKLQDFGVGIWGIFFPFPTTFFPPPGAGMFPGGAEEGAAQTPESLQGQKVPKFPEFVPKKFPQNFYYFFFGLKSQIPEVSP